MLSMKNTPMQNMTDAEFRLFYTSRICKLEDWNLRLNRALGISEDSSMEAAVLCVERDRGTNVVPYGRRRLEPT